MNVSCTSCSAKYAIPDEKVRGKKVKITCKHCGTGIIVDGTKIDAVAADPAPAPTASAAPAAAAAPAPSPLAAPAPVPAAAPAASIAAEGTAAVAAKPADEELRFDIAYPDDRQETLSVSEIVDKYEVGALDDDAFIWRDGMTDWKAPFDIPELASALGARGLKKKSAAAAQPFLDDNEPTKVQDSPFEGIDPEAAGIWREPGKEAPSSPAAAFDLTARAGSPLPFDEPAAPVAASPTPAAASPKPAAALPKAEPAKAAARRPAARGGGDLFGDLAGAGSEADESLGSEAKDGPKMTGARNESSVLFSLDALVKQEKQAPKTAPKEDANSIFMGGDSGPSSISNIGTGQFGSAFAAPDFTAPVTAPPVAEARASDPVEISTAATPAKKKGGMGLIIGLGVLVAAAAAAFATGLPAKLMGTPAPAPSVAPAAKQEPAPTPEAPPAAPAPEASVAPSAAAPAAGGAPAAAPATGGAPAFAAKPADPTKPAEPAKAAEPSKPAEEAAKPAAAATDAPPFDKAAAIAALTAAAGNAQSCKTPDGPTGGGKVSITFMPSGRATNTQVSGDLAGTAVGGCVARLFRSAKIPAFSGDAVTVSKSFSVQ